MDETGRDPVDRPTTAERLDAIWAVPDAAVQIVEEAMVGVSATRSRAETVAAALRAVGYLTPPAEVAALRERIDRLETAGQTFVNALDKLDVSYGYAYARAAFRVVLAELDALPPADQPAPAPPQGEDAERDPTICTCTDYARRHRPGAGLCVRDPMPMKIRDAVPHPAGETDALPKAGA